MFISYLAVFLVPRKVTAEKGCQFWAGLGVRKVNLIFSWEGGEISKIRFGNQVGKRSELQVRVGVRGSFLVFDFEFWMHGCESAIGDSSGKSTQINTKKQDKRAVKHTAQVTRKQGREGALRKRESKPGQRGQRERGRFGVMSQELGQEFGQDFGHEFGHLTWSNSNKTVNKQRLKEARRPVD